MEKLKAFTLIELLIGIVIASILLALAVPALDSIITRNQIITQTNQFIAALNLARSEAIKRGVTTQLVSSDATVATNEWGQGWRVEVAADGTDIRVYEALDNNTLNASSGNAFQFNSKGFIDRSDDLDLCHAAGETGRRISINATGRANVTEISCS